MQGTATMTMGASHCVLQANGGIQSFKQTLCNRFIATVQTCAFHYHLVIMFTTLLHRTPRHLWYTFSGWLCICKYIIGLCVCALFVRVCLFVCVCVCLCEKETISFFYIWQSRH